MMRRIAIGLGVFALSACAWGVPFVVNTTEDLAAVSGNRVSLRAALNATMDAAALPNDGNAFRITFGDELFAATNEVTVSLTGSAAIALKTGKVTVQGRTDDKIVNLRVQGFSGANLTTDAGVNLVLEHLNVQFDTSVSATDGNAVPKSGVFLAAKGSFALYACSFTGGGSQNGYLVSSTGTATDAVGRIEQCSFTGTRCGTLYLRGNHRYVLVNNTFADIQALNEKGVVQLEGGGSANSLFASCTMVDCKSPNGALHLLKASHAGGCATNVVVNSLLAFNLNTSSAKCDVYTDSGTRAICFYSAYSALNAGGTLAGTNNVVLGSAAASSVFGHGLYSAYLNGTKRAFRPVKRGGPADRVGAFLLHDETWENAAALVSLRRMGEAYGQTLCGSPSKTPMLLDEDVAARPVWTSRVNWQASATYAQVPDLRATPGSYATVTDGEAVGTPGLCEVTSLADEALAEDGWDAYDGVLTLREAVAFLARQPIWRDAAGDARIRFAAALFDGFWQRTFTLSAPQLEIDGIGRGTLTVAGVISANHRLILNGGSRRLFYVAPGNRVVFQGLAFTNALAEAVGAVDTTAGGAIYNAGHAILRDCAFTGCQAPVAGHGDGGALANAAGATAIVERCSFAGCSALNGGALANAAAGSLVVYASSFAENRARGSTDGVGACGGAVYAPAAAARTALVNCTLAGNAAEASGGGLWAAGDAAETRVYLLNTVSVGNRGEGAGRDVCVPGKACVRTCWLGDCQDVAAWDVDPAETAFDRVPADLFAARGAQGAAVTAWRLSDVAHVLHAYHALSSLVVLSPRVVFASDDWRCVKYAGSVAATPVTLWADEAGESVPTRRGDDLWGPLGTGVTAYPGASSRTETPDAPPPADDDPLCVTVANEAAFRAAVRYAAEHPQSASNGCLTVRFAGAFTIALAEPLTLSEFASVPLRLAGPVTFTGGAAHRLFTVSEGNRLVLEDVTLASGYDDEKGGAVYVESGALTATRCTFKDCTTGTGADGYFGLGGAVALWTARFDGVLPTALFTDCVFTGCTAGTGSYGAFGHDVYQPLATCAIFRGNLFDGDAAPRANDLYAPPGVCVEKGSGVNCYYGAVSTALAQECRAGDTLVRLSEDAPVPDDAALPPGVSFRDDTGGGFSLLLLSNTQQALTASGRDYYAATLVTDAGGRATGIRVALKAEAVTPALTGAGAQVDLAGAADVVSVVPANVKPGLWYGLGRSATPTGDFAVGTWLQADENGRLPAALTAPRTGVSGFYRVRVTDCP